jgi:hypothetical protein
MYNNIPNILNFMGRMYIVYVMGFCYGTISLGSIIHIIFSENITCGSNGGASYNPNFMDLSTWFIVNAIVFLACTLIGILLISSLLMRLCCIWMHNYNFIKVILVSSIVTHIITIPVNIMGCVILFQYPLDCIHKELWLILTLVILAIQWLDMGFICLIGCLKCFDKCYTKSNNKYNSI